MKKININQFIKSNGDLGMVNVNEEDTCSEFFSKLTNK